MCTALHPHSSVFATPVSFNFAFHIRRRVYPPIDIPYPYSSVFV